MISTYSQQAKIPMPTTITFSSEKGGVGKTTSAVNLAMAFVVGGYRVLLIDMDPQGSVRFSFGVRDRPILGLKEMISDPSIPLSDLCIPAEKSANLEYVLANFETLREERQALDMITSPSDLKMRLSSEAQDYDLILLDAPSSTNLLALNAITAANLVVLPLQCEALAIKSLRRYLVTFKELQLRYNRDLRIAGVLLTMYNRSLEVHRRICQQMYQSLKESVFSTMIPEVQEITEASALGQSVITYQPSSIGATAYVRLSKEILDRFQLRENLSLPLS